MDDLITRFIRAWHFQLLTSLSLVYDKVKLTKVKVMFISSLSSLVFIIMLIRCLLDLPMMDISFGKVIIYGKYQGGAYNQQSLLTLGTFGM